MENPAGIVAFVVVVVWLLYFVPLRLRHRQRIADARVGDRFSENLRVVAVASGLSVERTPVRSRAEEAQAKQLLTPPRRDVRRRAAPLSADAPHAVTRGMGIVEGPEISAARRELLAKRKAGARRRSVLAASLFALVVFCGVLSLSTSLTAWTVAVPAVALVAVLVLGRRAVVAAARFDAELSRRADLARRAERAAHEAAAHGRPAVSRPAAVARPRAASGALAAAAVARAAALTGQHAAVSADDVVTPAAERRPDVTAEETTTWSLRSSKRTSGAPDAVAAQATVSQPDAATADEPGHQPDRTEAVAERQRGAAGTLSRAPLPTYAVKPAAPAWEPAPLSAEIERVTRRLAAWDDEDGVAAHVEIAAGTQPVEFTAAQAVDDDDAAAAVAAKESTFAASLDAALERRRAIGA